MGSSIRKHKAKRTGRRAEITHRRNMFHYCVYDLRLLQTHKPKSVQPILSIFRFPNQGWSLIKSAHQRVPESEKDRLPPDPTKSVFAYLGNDGEKGRHALQRGKTPSSLPWSARVSSHDSSHDTHRFGLLFAIKEPMHKPDQISGRGLRSLDGSAQIHAQT